MTWITAPHLHRSYLSLTQTAIRQEKCCTTTLISKGRNFTYEFSWFPILLTTAEIQKPVKPSWHHSLPKYTLLFHSRSEAIHSISTPSQSSTDLHFRQEDINRVHSAWLVPGCSSPRSPSAHTFTATAELSAKTYIYLINLNLLYQYKSRIQVNKDMYYHVKCISTILVECSFRLSPA